MSPNPTRTFSDELREGTAVEHDRAEHAPFVDASAHDEQSSPPLPDDTDIGRAGHARARPFEACYGLLHRQCRQLEGAQRPVAGVAGARRHRASHRDRRGHRAFAGSSLVDAIPRSRRECWPMI